MINHAIKPRLWAWRLAARRGGSLANLIRHSSKPWAYQPRGWRDWLGGSEAETLGHDSAVMPALAIGRHINKVTVIQMRQAPSGRSADS
jgi:hypothetical protein